MSLILASASPRRREILETCGFDFHVKVSDVNEDIDKNMAPKDYVMLLAKEKALAIECSCCDVVISADTVVVLDEKIMGKPKDFDDAYAILKTLSGNTHSVFTGVCLKNDKKYKTFFCETQVVFHDLSDDQILNYIKSGEPMDKAGAYGIQGKGALLVKEIHGDYFNVVGLPVSSLAIELQKFTK